MDKITSVPGYRLLSSLSDKQLHFNRTFGTHCKLKMSKWHFKKYENPLFIFSLLLFWSSCMARNLVRPIGSETRLESKLFSLEKLLFLVSSGSLQVPKKSLVRKEFWILKKIMDPKKFWVHKNFRI